MTSTSASDFATFYDVELRPQLEIFETRRKGIVRKLLSYIAIVLGVTAAALGMTVLLVVPFDPGALWPAGIVAVVGFLAVAFGMQGKIKAYKHAFKQAVIGPIVRFVDPELRYSPAGGIPEYEFINSGLFRSRIDRYNHEDQVKGMLGKTSVRFSEVKAEYKKTTTNSKGQTRTTWHTIFDGLFFIADFNKDFQGRTLVFPDTAQRLLGSFGQWLQSIGTGSKGDLVKLEDPEFEKYFAVHSDDQVEARYILSPSLMKRLTDFRRQTNRTTHISFVDSSVYIAITMRKNLFEPPVYTTVLNPHLADEYLHDIRLATDIVEELNLNTRIWTKE